MGRDTTRREMNYQEAAMESFRLEQNAGVTFNTAFRNAVEAAVSTANREALSVIRDDIMQKAEWLDSQEDNDLIEDGTAALLMYAKMLDDTLPPEYRLGGI